MPAKTIRCPDISCGHCTATIQTELGQLAGVSGVFADPNSKEVMLSWEESDVSWERIRTRLVELGFPPDSE